MRISILGLGYVGAVSAGCLAKQGHTVIGVDPNQVKVDLINQGTTPIIEKGIGDIIAQTVRQGLLSATTDVVRAVTETDMSFICVGTPSQPNGSLDMRYVRRACEDIGIALRNKSDFHVVVARSTMLPGSMQEIVIPTIEEFSGKKAAQDFGICNNPEFLREGTAVHDFYNPPKTVIGETDELSGQLLATLYAHINAPLIRTTVATAEMVKYTDNAWHALKVGFANEIGNICKALSLDGHEVMDVFCQDTKLNISPYYLKPGFAFGGSCLPKDVRALTYKARSMDLTLPILDAILPSNAMQVDRGFRLVTANGHRNIGILGFSFKAGTDDLRESPMVELAERLIGKGYNLRLYDRNVSLAKLVGANRDYILNHIPHISSLMVDSPDEIIRHSETIVIGNADPEFEPVLDRLTPTQLLIDLVRAGNLRTSGHYEGICW